MGSWGQLARVLGKFLDNGRRHTVTEITVPLAHAGEDGRAGPGLAIARNVVRNHGGELTVTEAPSGSTAFLLALSRTPHGRRRRVRPTAPPCRPGTPADQVRGQHNRSRPPWYRHGTGPPDTPRSVQPPRHSQPLTCSLA
ncbi:sensor histidine kinase [Streptomyces sp. MBT65]|uniref:ATP-binding protein n=1 Tax=Streptomyces sp. MBT65 TaxID=1488395 RepID=UPI00190945E4|nr:sensor histidine kinase [Streptomyces sp. MBT65]MBK3578811.1 sensor histidine kinase [Streptomyces sp. MBT65]